MVAEEVVVSLSGGAPWGFRLQGGAEHHKPLQVAKVRRRSKACRAGLKEDDELVAIDNHVCTEISHAQAMSLIDSQRTILHLKVKRSPSLHISSPPAASLPSRHPPSLLSPPGGGGGITSPPDSEAYYGETDSDADTQTHAQRRQRRTPPHARSPARHDSREEEETSGMSGYESATDGGVSLQGQWEAPGPGECLPGVPRRELVYEPPPAEWATPAHTPHTLTPHTLTPTPDLGLTEGEGEGDSGFQEAGGCVVLACPSLVSPEMAKGSLMLGSSRQLVPMVGLQQIPVSDELSTTYMDKARQARLHRGESVVEKQVKEARTKCRSIASLLTDAPNPNSKGVLMFKKRRQRAKKYTLTCFGKAEGDGGGETEGETEEEGGSSILSGSEVDEEGFSASYDPTWDSGYLDLLDRRSSACPSTTPTTPTTPTTNHSFPLDISTYQSPGFVNSVGQSPGLEYPGLNGSAYESSRLERGSTKQPISANAAPTSSHMSPPSMALTNGGSVVVSRASVVLSPASQSPLPNELGLQNLNMNQSPNAMGVLNRTARPFTSGPTSARSPVAPVVFRPPQPKPITVTTLTKPVAAVSMVNIPPHRQPSGQEARRAVSSTSLYISPRNNNNSYAASPLPALCSPPMHNPLSPPTSPASAAFAQPFTQINHQPQFSPQVSGQSVLYPASSAPFSSLNGPSLPPAAQGPPLYPLPPQPFSPSAPPADQPFPPPNTPVYLPPSSGISAPPHLPPQLNAPTQVYFQAQPTAPPPQPSAQAQPSPPLSFNPCTNMASALMNSTIPAPPQPPVSDSLASREQRISVPAARTGILQDARRRSNKKPMFCSVQNRDVSPNPALLSMLQNIDSHTGTVPASVGPSGDAGHESGPEEDWLRLGAEACNFMQAQRGPRPPPVAPKPQAPQLSQLEGKGGQLFARRQSRMDRYVVERSPSVAAAPYHPAQTREPSPTPSLPATWKYSSNIRAPPPISYNPLLSPSCPLKVQKPQKAEAWRSGSAKSKAGAQKGGIKPVDIMSHQPYQLSSSLFTYAGGTPQNTATSQQQQQEMMGSSQGPKKTARLYEVKRFSTPPPTATGPTLKVIMPRSATTLGEPMCRSDLVSPLPAPSPVAYQTHLPQLQPSTMPYQSQPPQWASSPLSPPPPPAPTAPLPQLPTLPVPAHIPTFSHLQSSSAVQANRQFKSTPDLSPLSPAGGPRLGSSCALPARVPRPRFSTSTLGLQPCVWRPGSNGH